MTECKVIDGNIIVNGELYSKGDTVELSNEQASKLKAYVQVTKPASKPQTKTVNYDDYTVSQLEALVKKQNIEIEATGKNGRPVRQDYIDALNNAE